MEGNRNQMVEYRIHTLAGVITPQITFDGQVKVDMGCTKAINKFPLHSLAFEKLLINLEVAGQSLVRHQYG